MQGAERERLLAQLVHPDEELRRLATESVSQLPAALALPLLVERLADESWRVRKAAIGRLAALPERAGAVGALLEAIADGENPGRRNAALEALIACGRTATPELVEALASPDVDVRKQVVDVLGAIGDARAEDALGRALGDSDANVRAAAADALGALGGRAHAAALLRLASGDAESLVRVASLRALVQVNAEIPFAAIEAALADPLLAAAGYAALAQSEAPDAIELAFKGLLARRASVREAAARAVIALVSRAGAEEAERIAQRLGEFARAHAEVESGAVVWIEDAAPDAKLAAVQFAALLRTPEAACALVQCGGDAAVAGAARIALSALGAALPGALARAWPRLSPAERAFACGALATCGDAPSAERMLRTTLLDPASEVRAAAARALGACATSASFGELLGRLAQEDPRASREAQEDECDALVEAVVQLAQREGGEAVDAAIALVEARLLGADERARAAGARLLAQLARPADAGRVRALLGDASERVRRCAVEAVVGLGHAAGSEELLRVALADEAPGVRGAAAHAVARLGLASAEGDLAVLAGDRDARVRAAAMSALAVRARVPEARAAALQMLATGVGGDGIVALAALAALQQIGGTDAAALAAAGLRSAEPEIVEAAVGCVGAHGGEALRGELIGLLAHPAWPVRARAARELAEQRAAAALPQLHARLAEERDEFVREALLAALAALES